MGRTMTLGKVRWALVLAIMAGTTQRAGAIYLDDAQNISLRARIYSRASIRLNDSQTDTEPPTKRGQLVENRNFYNPELDAKLTSYTSWMKGTSLSLLAPDDLSFRLAAWGFYDGVYDYGAKQFGTAASQINSTFGNFTSSPSKAWFLEGSSFNCPSVSKGGAPACQTTYTNFDQVFPGAEVQNVRDVYGHRQRVNELYTNYSKGPFFLRVGRQSISWGESDTIGILDQNNPFDVTLGAPGVFEDLDEARIPLWTVRSSYTLFDNLGPFSSAFVEAYWVPGDLDTNTGILPILGASPYSVRGQDPQLNPTITGFNQLQESIGRAPLQFVLLDGVPRKEMSNSRYGFRFQTIIGRDVTASVWMYTHFPNAPVPVKLPVTQFDNRRFFTIETVHKITPVVGGSATFYAEPLDGIVRAEVEYFNHEPGFIPEKSLNIDPNSRTSLKPLLGYGSVPYADYIRWELGFDRFFFFRPLNPSNSFTWVTALVGSWNMDETSKEDFRMNGQQKPGTEGSSPSDFVQQEKVEAFFQTHLQTDYLHGRIAPGMTGIFNVRGTYALLPSVTYRFADWLLFDASIVHIGGQYEQIGFFRDRDQIALRATYQLN